jgi:hypothetical protein
VKQVLPTILTRDRTRMRVKEIPLPMTHSILGNLLDATNLPEGHLSCPKCKQFRFEASGFPGGCKVELGCTVCNERIYMSFPTNTKLPTGRFSCWKHPKKAMMVIHNVETVCIGCESCRTQILIKVDKQGILLA